MSVHQTTTSIASSLTKSEQKVAEVVKNSMKDVVYGDIEEELAIELGENIISIRIEVDGYITHQREFTVYGTWAELDLLEQLGELKDLVTEYIQHPPGIRQSLDSSHIHLPF